MKIPLILSNIELEHNFKYFSIGRFKYQLYLLIKLNISEILTNQENINNIAQYISTNNSNPYHLYCFGLFREISFGNFYLVYEYPIYTLGSFLSTNRTQSEKTKIYFHFEQYYSTFNKTHSILLYGEDFFFINKHAHLKCLNLPFKPPNRSRKINKCLFPLFEELFKNIIKKVFINSHSRNCFMELLKQIRLFITTYPQEQVSISPILYSIIFDDDKEHNIINKVIENDNGQDIIMNVEYVEEYNEFDISLISVHEVMEIMSKHWINPLISLTPLQNKMYMFMLEHFPICSHSRFYNVYYTMINKYTNTDCLRNKDIPMMRERSELKEFKNEIEIVNGSSFSKIRNRENKEMFYFRKVYDVNNVKNGKELQEWLDEVKIVWMNSEGKKYPFKEDIVLMFLDVCNYDMEKALKCIKKSNKLFMKFIKNEFGYQSN